MTRWENPLAGHPTINNLILNMENKNPAGDSNWPFLGWLSDPFKGVKWPPTRGSKGHFESPGSHSFVFTGENQQKTQDRLAAWTGANESPQFLL